MERLNHIRIRVQVLLIIALFASTGILCRQHNADRQTSCVATVLTQSANQQAPGASLIFIRSLLASDLSGGIVTENFTKAQVRQIETTGWGIHTRAIRSVLAPNDYTVPPPDAKEYYILTLGKIRI